MKTTDCRLTVDLFFYTFLEMATANQRVAGIEVRAHSDPAATADSPLPPYEYSAYSLPVTRNAHATKQQ